MRDVAAHSNTLDIQDVLDVQTLDGVYGSKAAQLQLTLKMFVSLHTRSYAVSNASAISYLIAELCLIVLDGAEVGQQLEEAA